LKLKFLDGSKEGQEKYSYFLSRQNTSTFEDIPAVTIGRLVTCTIPVDDYGVSRTQCKLSYDKGKWWIQDGDGIKSSTNGTW